MARSYDLLIRAKGDTRDAQKDLGRLGTAAKGAGAKLKGALAAGAKYGALALAAGLAVAARAGINELRESRKVSAQAASALKSLGKEAFISEQSFDKLASTLAYKASIDDEVVKNAMAQTLAFKNVRDEAGKNNDIFTRLTKVSADYAARTGKDLVQSQVKFAKSLNQPEKGLGMLRKAGVSFTEAQEEQIKTLAKSGKTMEAQKIILAQMEARYKGAAAAAGNADPWNRLRETFNNLTATIVGGLGKGVGGLANKLSAAMLQLDLFLKSARGASILNGVRDIVMALFAGWDVLRKGIGEAVGEFKKAFGEAGKNKVQLKDVAKAVGDASVAFAKLAVKVLPPLAKILGTVAGFFNRHRTLLKVVAIALAAMVNPIAGVVLAYAIFHKRVNAAVRAVVEGTKDAVATIRDKWNAMVDYVAGLPGRITRATAGMWNGITNAFRAALNYIIGKWNALDLKLSLPSKLGGGSIGIGTPDIPYMARGGIVRRAGVAVVGENGPELLDFPEGARVTPLGRAGGLTQHFYFTSEPDMHVVAITAANAFRTAGLVSA